MIASFPLPMEALTSAHLPPGPGGAPGASGPSPAFAPVRIAAVPGGASFDGNTDQLFVSLPSLDRVLALNLSTKLVVANLSVGTDPEGLAYDAENDRVFVANNGSDNVSVIDARTDRVVSSVPVGSSPTGVGYDADNASVYVPDYGSANVTVFDAATLRATASIPVLAHPFGISADGGYVTHPGLALATAIDERTNTVYQTYSTGPDPQQSACGYVTNAGGDSVTELGSPGRTVAVGKDPTGIACTNGAVFVANSGSDNVSVLEGTRVVATLDLANAPGTLAADSLTNGVLVGGATQATVTSLPAWVDAPVGEISAPGGVLALADDPSDGTLLAANASSASIALLNASSWSTEGWVALPQKAVAVVPDPALGVDLAALATSGRIVEINTSRGEVVGTFATVAGASALAYDPGKGSVYVTDAKSARLYDLNATTGRVRKMVHVGSDPTSVDFSVSLEEIAVANSGSNTLTLINRTTLAPIRSVPTGRVPSAVRYDPSGGNLFVANSQSDNVTLLSPSGQTTSVTVGRDPVALAYVPGPDQVYVANNRSSNVSVLSGATGLETASIFAPDPTAFAVDPATGLLYVASRTTPNISVVPTQRSGLIGLLEPQAHVGLGGFQAVNGSAFVNLGSTLDEFSATNGSFERTVGQYATPVSPYDEETATLVAPGPSAGSEYVVFGGSFGPIDLLSGPNASLVAQYSHYPSNFDSLSYDPTYHVLFAKSSTVLDELNATSLALVKSLTLAGNVVAVDPVAGEIFVLGSSTTLTVLRESTVSVIQTVTLPFVPTGGLLNGNGSLLYLTSRTLLGFFDTSNNSVLRTTAISSKIGLVGLDPATGSFLGLEAGAREIFEVSGTTGKIVTSQVLPVPVGAVNLELSSGALVALSAANQRLVTLNATSLALVSSVPLGPSLDPLDGSYLLDAEAADVYCLDCRSIANGRVPVPASSMSKSVQPGDTDLTITPCTNATGLLILDSVGTGEAYSRVSVKHDCPAPGAQRASVTVGTDPGAILEAGSTNDFYVLNAGSNSLSLIHFPNQTFRTIGSLAVGLEPVAGVDDPADHELFVVNAGSDNVSVVDTTSQRVVASIPVGVDPDAVVLDSADDVLYVANFGSANLTEIDARSDAVLGSLPVPAGPDALAVDPAQGLLLVHSEATGEVLGLRWGSVIFTVDAPPGPAQIELDPQLPGEFLLASRGAVDVASYSIGA